MRKLLNAIGTVILLVGAGSFVVQWCLLALGSHLVLRGLDWPVSNPAQAVRLPDGRYVVALLGRIQVYSPAWQFQYGWQTASHSNLLRLRTDGTLAAYTATRRNVNRWGERVYDANGVLLSSQYINATRDQLPGQPAQPMTVPHTILSWTLFPLYGPFYAFAAALLGGLLKLATGGVGCRTSAREAPARRVLKRFLCVPLNRSTDRT